MIPLHAPGDALRPTAIALGSFDGLHAGHRRVIEAVTAAAQEPSSGSDAFATVVSFWPHPREVLHGDARLRLDLPEEKLAILEPMGIQQLVLVPFTRELAQLSPEAFVERVLVDQLQARRIAVGENFRFGAGRSGSARDLRRIGEDAGVSVRVLPMLWDGQEQVSSSRIRRALATGSIAEANRLLDRPYRFSGQVVKGRGLGHQLGWPTANLKVNGRKFLPMQGVYAARAWLAREGDGAPQAELLPMAAVMNLGHQPTIDPLAPAAVEVHLLDRHLDLEGSNLIVEPLLWLRQQKSFGSLEALTAQIGRDAQRARQILVSAGEVQA